MIACFARRSTGVWLAGSVAAAVLAGCSFDWSAEHVNPGAGGAGAGSGTGTTGTTGTASGGGMTGTGATSGAGAGAPSLCPATPPSIGDDCAGEPNCEYGDDPRPSCRLKIQCDDGNWKVENPCNCPPPTDALCPPSSDDPAPTCPASPVLCNYDDKHCGCVNSAWECFEAPNGCPGTAPEENQPCTDPGLECAYGSCALSTGIKRRCENGVWKKKDPGCVNAPVSCM